MFNLIRLAIFVSSTISLLSVIEPAREGRFSDRLRGSTTIVSDPNPSITVLSPADSGVWSGEFIVGISEFDYQPDLATDPVNAFASGYQEKNRGHIHGWVFDESGNQVRFYGAAGTTFENGLYIKPDEFPPGRYRAFFQLQNHDHTPLVQASAPAFPAIDAIVFDVEEGPSVDPGLNVPNCGCGQTPCSGVQGSSRLSKIAE